MKIKHAYTSLYMALIVSLICGSVAPVSYAYNTMSIVSDDFESYSEGDDIVGFTAINSKTIPNDGRMTPAEGYKWAERYDSDSAEDKGFEPAAGIDPDGQVGKLFNYDGKQFYRVSSTSISGCNANTVVVSGRFCIPNISAITNGFFFGVTPKERYDSKNFESFCNLISVNAAGELYKSVMDDEAAWGASDEKIEGAFIESGVWYNAVFMIENSVTRKYIGRVFTDDGSVDITIDNGYLAKTASNGDDSANELRLGLRLGRAAAANNMAYVDDLYIFTTDFQYGAGIPNRIEASVEQSGANEMTVKLAKTIFFEDEFNSENIEISTDEGGVELEYAEYRTEEHSLVLKLAENMLPGRTYHIDITDTYDVFGNRLASFDYTTAPPSFTVDNVDYQINGEHSIVLKSGIIICTAEVSNATETDVDTSMILALYKNGIMVNMSCGDAETVQASGNATINCTMDCTAADAKDCVLITYFWNSFEGGAAVFDPWQLDVSGVYEVRQ